MHQDLSSRRQAVIDSDTLGRLVERTDYHGIWRLVQHGCALSGSAWLMVSLPQPANLAAGLVYGILLAFLFCPLHESIHRSLFATRQFNLLVGFFAGLILLLPPRYFRCFHMAHHRYTQQAGSDPELDMPKPATVLQYCWYVSGIPYAVSAIKILLRGSVGLTDRYVPEGERGAVIREARIFSSIYACAALASILSASAMLVWFWIVPLAAGQPFLRMFLLAEHTGCDRVKTMFDNTRTTWTNPLMQWLCWNMNHHTAHHAYAGVPFFRLPEVSRLIRPHIRFSERGYWCVQRDIVRQVSA